jgi:hypothetical protein
VQKLKAAPKAGAPSASEKALAAARAELRAAGEAFDLASRLNNEIRTSLSSMRESIDRAEAEASAAGPFTAAVVASANQLPTGKSKQRASEALAELTKQAAAAKTKAEQAERLLAATLVTSKAATSGTDAELATGIETTTASLAELDALAKALATGALLPAKSASCDIRKTNWANFKYPAPFKQPMKDGNLRTDSGYYDLDTVLYADLNGNGRPEAIVPLNEGFAGDPQSGCNWEGSSTTFVYELDAQCALQKLAVIDGSTTDSRKVQGTTLVVDEPYFTLAEGEPRCMPSGLRHIVWQFKTGKFASTVTEQGRKAEPPPKPKSCLQEIGAAQSKQLVLQCIQISPATHPPCNAQNDCAMIKDEIRRGCSLSSTKPAFCASFPP